VLDPRLLRFAMVFRELPSGSAALALVKERRSYETNAGDTCLLGRASI
jgi:hypothetical protein